MGAVEMDALTEMFAGMKFRRQIFGGVSEADVWKKMDQVQNEYRRLYEKQAAGYEARIEERDAQIRKLQEQLSARETGESGSTAAGGIENEQREE